MDNYFDFFNLSPSPELDQAALKRTFYANSKRFHPDFHTLADTATQQEVLEKSTLNNQAYKVLKDEDQRLKHLLDIKEVLGEEGSNQVPQEFLMEIMEVNEALMELEFAPDEEQRTRVRALIENLEAELKAEVEPIIMNYDDATVTPTNLEALKNYYLKRRYLLRLREKI